MNFAELKIYALYLCTFAFSEILEKLNDFGEENKGLFQVVSFFTIVGFTIRKGIDYEIKRRKNKHHDTDN